MSMFTRSDRASVKPPGSGDKFPLWLNLKTGHRVRGWYELKTGHYMTATEPPNDINDQVDTWEVVREMQR